MNRKKIATVAVSALLLVAIIIGATGLYGNLSGRMPADLPLAPPVQGGGTANPPSGNQQADGIDQQPAPEQGSGAAEVPRQDDNGRTLAPDFTVQDAEGNEVRLSDRLGKPVVLNFWASWCPPCRVEMPDFNTVFEDIGHEVNFMMVCIVDGARETRDTGAAYIEENGYTFPVYYDIGQDAAMQYAIRSIPTTMFIDADGYVVTWAEGAIPEETLRLGISHIVN